MSPFTKQNMKVKCNNRRCSEIQALYWNLILTFQQSSTRPSAVWGMMWNEWSSRAVSFKYLEHENAKPGCLSIQGGKDTFKSANSSTLTLLSNIKDPKWISTIFINCDLHLLNTKPFYSKMLSNAMMCILKLTHKSHEDEIITCLINYISFHRSCINFASSHS